MTVYYGRSVSQIFNNGAFAGVRADGSIVTWGKSDTGGVIDDALSARAAETGVREIVSNSGAFAALLEDGSVIAWGDPLSGGDVSAARYELNPDFESRVTGIYASDREFAALREDGSVVIWGGAYENGTDPDASIEPFAFAANDPARDWMGSSQHSPITDVATGDVNGGKGFAFLLEDGGAFVRWQGRPWEQYESGLAERDIRPSGPDDPQATKLYDHAPEYALMDDGSVQHIGALSLSPLSRAFDPELPGIENPADVVANAHEVAVLEADGTVTTFGPQHEDPVQRVSGGARATEIYANDNNFAALLSDGSVATWSGHDRQPDWNLEDAEGYDQLEAALSGEDGPRVVEIVPGRSGFSAIRDDGSVVSWDITSRGGDIFDPDDNDRAEIDVSVFGVDGQSMERVVASGDRFLGLSDAGEVYGWQPGLDDIEGIKQDAYSEDFGGVTTFTVGSDRDVFAPVADIFSAGDNEFSILRTDGTVLHDVWGTVSDSLPGVDIAHSAYDGLSIGDVLDDDSPPVDPETPPVPEIPEPPEGPETPEGPEDPQEPETPAALYQPTTEDLEIAARLIAYQKLGDQPGDYHAFGSAGNPSTFVAEHNYSFEVIEDDENEGDGFFAIGMTSPTAEPILAVRGTVVNTADFITDFDPDGVGTSQIEGAWDEITEWVALATSEDQALNITGHSLGGAQTQIIASRLGNIAPAEGDDANLGTIATFNSPGIEQTLAFQFLPISARETVHFISSGDVVSLAGEEFIKGDVKYSIFNKIEYDSTTGTSIFDYLVDTHTGYWSQPSLYEEIGTISGGGIIRPLDDFREVESVNFSGPLGNPAFSYMNPSGNLAPFDQEFAAFAEEATLEARLILIGFTQLEAISSPLKAPFSLHETSEFLSEIDESGGVLGSRGNVEAFRVETGESVFSLLETVDAAISTVDYVTDITARWEDLQDVPENIWGGIGIDPGAAGARFGTWLRGLSQDDAIYTGGTAFHEEPTPAFMLGQSGDDLLVSQGGQSVLSGGHGADDYEINGSGNTIFGSPEQLDGDYISGFGSGDLLFYSTAKFIEDQLRVEEGSAILNVDSDGDGVEDSVVTLEGNYDIDAFKVHDMGTGTGITYQPNEGTPPVVPCFTPGSLAMTKRGLVACEDIRQGDLLVTRDNGYQEVTWIGHRKLSQAELASNDHLAPIRIRQGALGGDVPDRDMLVSPQHNLLWTTGRSSLLFADQEVFVPAKHLTYLPGIERLPVKEVVYLHFMFERHEILLVDGVWSESFNPGQCVLTGMHAGQRDELLELFPDLRQGKNPSAFTAARRMLKKHEARLLYS